MQFDREQQLAVQRMKSGSILVGGVGSGKSRTGLYYYFVKECKGSVEINGEQLYSPMKEPKDLYIITTAAKRDKHEWENEMAPFLLSVDKNKNYPKVKVIIDSWNNIKKYEDVLDSFFIFDEQRVVGSGTWAKTFIKISKRNHWILLSATPGDTWSDYIPVFIANGFYKNRTEFVKRHIIFSRFTNYPKIERYIETDRLEKIRNLILVDMKVKRNTVKESKVYRTEYDKEKYNTVVKDRWNFYEDKPIENASQYTYLLRKIVNSDQSRIDRCKKLILERNKVIIFYNYDYELDILRQIGKELKIKTHEWNGHKHMPVPNGEKWIYLVQYNSGAEGWNCTTTDTIIFYSLSYSYRMMHQASGRIDRRDTKYSKIFSIYLKSDSTIDSAVWKALKNKQNFNERKFVESTSPIIGGESI